MDLTFTKSFGKAQQLSGLSLSTFIATLSTSVAIFFLQLILFFLLKRVFPTVYPSTQCTLNSTKLSLRRLIRFEASTSNLDIYFFQRYLRTLVIIFLPASFFITPVLIPLNAISGKSVAYGVQGLDTLAWPNVGLNHADRYWGHLFLGLAFIVYLEWTIWSELALYISLRQRSPCTALRTVLIDSVPEAWMNGDAILKSLGILSQGVQDISFSRDYNSLEVLLQRREKKARALEVAKTQMIRSAIKDRTTPMLPKKRSVYALTQFLPRWQPHSVATLLSQIEVLSYEIDRLRNKPERFPKQSSVFVTFSTPAIANTVCQTIMHKDVGYMTPRILPMRLNDVIWDNLSRDWWSRTIHTVICNIAIVFLAIVCVVPAAFAGLLSQIIYLTYAIPWLSWVSDLPTWSLSILQGIIPPVILAILVSVYSSALEYLIQSQGIPLKSLVSLRIQDYYFYFLFVQVTLVVTLSAGLTSIVNEIAAGNSLPLTLAKNLPKASNYFLSYVLLQGLSVSANALLQLFKLASILIGSILDPTVTGMLERQRGRELQWGTFVPIYTNLACIGIIYSIISPIIIPLQVVIFALFSVVYSDFALATPADNGGLFYPKALKHLQIGIYGMELALTVLFFLVRDSSGQTRCVGQACFMIGAIALTMVFHRVLCKVFDPLLAFSPTCIRNYTDDCPQFISTALTSIPIIQLPKDGQGLSSKEVGLIHGIEVRDDKATIDSSAHIQLNLAGPIASTI